MFDFLLTNNLCAMAVLEAIKNVEHGQHQAEIQRLKSERDRERNRADYFEQLYLHEKLKNDNCT